MITQFTPVVPEGQLELLGRALDFDASQQRFSVNGHRIEVTTRTRYRRAERMIASSEFWGGSRVGGGVEVHGERMGCDGAVLAETIVWRRDP